MPRFSKEFSQPRIMISSTRRNGSSRYTSAILGIAATGIHRSIKLISFTSQVKSAQDDITDIAENVSLNTSISAAVGWAGDNETPQPKLPAVPTIHDLSNKDHNDNQTTAPRTQQS
ncbi:hypothetical protein ASPACDRAFT_1859758 [Aspergillus aculeatus ATCC 16872]|uniref:Uncharacterized protein n=1 Tax=Aspergillus aculeatus (strain ATCC 16872 / CBS 172.66 / WB 5094) TaxID=690307 RepID=A0A1L9WIJ2_ASPA1|nr:uncharacterized protein ASPACDRAFT_1859758 [Aspergillus aculeatus ATCC 16872]OJJ95988.1 hypothetical protein ASPACDRAFT_1859758 [Aspergillus aculeatus ATCC 16872]